MLCLLGKIDMKNFREGAEYSKETASYIYPFLAQYCLSMLQ